MTTCAHSRLAVEDPVWRAIQSHVDIPYQVFHMSPHVLNAWTRIRVCDASSRPSSLIGLMHPDRLLKIRHLVVNRPLILEERVVEWGAMVTDQDETQRRLVEEEEFKKLKKKQKHEMRDFNNQLKAAEWAKQGARAEVIQEIRMELAKVLKKMEDFPQRPEPVERDRRHALPPSVLSSARIGTSYSTKLNYILNEVRITITFILAEITQVVVGAGPAVWGHREIFNFLKLSANLVTRRSRIGTDAGQVSAIHDASHATTS